MVLRQGRSRRGNPRWTWSRLSLALTLLLGSMALGCPSSSRHGADNSISRALPRPCPAEVPAPPVLPWHEGRHDLPDFWLARHGGAAEIQLSPALIEQQNQEVQRQQQDGRPTGRWDPGLLHFDRQQLQQLLGSKLMHLRQGISQGNRVLADGRPPTTLFQELERRLAQAQIEDEIRVVWRSTALRCFPTDEGLYEKAWDLAFDLMQCAQLRLGEPVRVMAVSGEYVYVWSSYADGWARRESLTPPLTPEQARTYLHPERFVVVQTERVALFHDKEQQQLVGDVRLGIHLPLLSEEEALLQVTIPEAQGLSVGWLGRAAASVGYPPLTLSQLYRKAFSLLNTPYGWGGMGEHRDCSRLMMDLFGAFGVLLPRNTWHQSNAGLRRIDVEQLSTTAKIEAIEAAAQTGIVLLYMPGHIMLYLGRDGQHLFAFHLFSGYLVPCAGGGETMNRVNHAVVTALNLGQGSSRRSFLQRITRLVVFSSTSGAD
jgi:cell wall-associated NlpC family hydrolase